MSSPTEEDCSSEEDYIEELVTLSSKLAINTDSTNNANSLEHHGIQQQEIKYAESIDELLLESFNWLRNTRNIHFNMKTLSSWVTLGARNNLDLNTKYADSEIVNNLCLALMHSLDDTEKRIYKQIVNPLEMVKRAFLMDRGSVKFASIDSLMGYMFSNPLDKRNKSLIQPNEIMYFVDIDGCPGGFVDYLLWRRDWQTKGFGFGSHYYTHRFSSGSQRFNTFTGAEHDSLVTKSDNIDSFVRYVKRHVSIGVHVVIADFGRSVDGRKYTKERIFKQLYLAEVIMALSLLRPNGHFILKLSDVFLPFTVGLIYLMYKCFAEICLIKPKTSRPSSSERYLLCKWKNENTENVKLHLLELNTTMNKMSETNNDVVQLVPEHVINDDTEFFNFIYNSNNLIAKSQTDALIKMRELKNIGLDNIIDSRDPSWVEECLQRWNVVPKTNENVFDCTFGEWTEAFIHFPENSLSPLLPLIESFNVPGDKLGIEWHFIPIENINKDKRGFFATTNSTAVMKFDPETSEWCLADDIGLQFPTNTFLYGEIVYHHIIPSGNRRIEPYGFHIIDGLILNGQDIRSKPYLSRMDFCKKFADAINNPSQFIKKRNGQRVKCAPIYCKEVKNLQDLVSYIETFRMSRKTTHNNQKVLGLNIQTYVGSRRFYEVKGLLFLRHFPKILDESNFYETFKCRQIWSWDRPYEILNTVDMDETPADESVYLSHFCDYLRKTSRNENLNSRQKNQKKAPSRYSKNRGIGSCSFKK